MKQLNDVTIFILSEEGRLQSLKDDEPKPGEEFVRMSDIKKVVANIATTAVLEKKSELFDILFNVFDLNEEDFNNFKNPYDEEEEEDKNNISKYILNEEEEANER